MLKRRAIASLATHEDLFIQRYRSLMRAALHLTGQDHELAEDLVHDVFIHFTLGRPELERLQNLDGYLYKMIRNMHVSQIRRNARVRATSVSSSELSISDYDFIADGLQALEQRTQQTRDELRRVCQYACTRKETSKAGSVLILRFLHGYYPNEIAQILRSTRASADKWLQIARSEAKLYLSDPAALGFIGKGAVELVISDSAQNTEDFVNQLRGVIFTSHPNECLPREKLQEIYFSKASGTVDCYVLSHIVSCHVCLDEVNTLLRLPLLKERYPTKTLNQDRRKQHKGDDSGSGEGSGGGSGVGGGDDFMSRSRRRLRKTVEHRPQQLRILVNGFILGSQDVSAEFNKQTISIKGEEKIGFVEIFSEQEVRLLFKNIEPPPDGPTQQCKRVELSDGRSLEMTLDFSESWPNLHVVYHDPSFAVVETPAAIESKAVRNEEAEVEAREVNTTRGSAWFSALQNFRRWTSGLRLLSRPGVVSAVVAGLLVIVVLVAQWRQPITPLTTAQELLEQASVREDSVASQVDQVLHRTINLQERSSTGALISQRRIEIWQSAERGLTARRLYDESGRLVKGDWRRNDGVQTLYQHGERPQLRIAPTKQNATSVDFENVWQLEASAREFRSFIESAGAASVQETAGAYIITYDRQASAPGILKATLVLNRADGELHVIEQTLVVRQNDEAREYRFVEANFERHSPSTVRPGVFEPDAELLTGHTAIPRSEEKEIFSSTPDPPTLPPPVFATAALEVEVLQLLSEARADLGEQISVTRMPNGILRVEGVIESPQRKLEILRALEPLRENPAVQVSINTVNEAIQRQVQPPSSPTSQVVVESAEPTTDAIAVDSEVRRYLSGRGVQAGQLDEEVRRFANRVVNRSRRAMYYGAAMKRLAERFSPQELTTLDAESRTKWLVMIRRHAVSFRFESAALRQELAPVFNVAGSPVEAGNAINDVDALVRSVSHLFTLSASNYNAIQSAFTISTGTARSPLVRSPEFWRSLVEAETLAFRIGIRSLDPEVKQ